MLQDGKLQIICQTKMLIINYESLHSLRVKPWREYGQSFKNREKWNKHGCTFQIPEHWHPLEFETQLEKMKKRVTLHH